jgi:hypothetical protein
MTTTGKNGAAVGDRIPAIWFMKDSSGADKIRIEIGTSSVNDVYNSNRNLYVDEEQLIGKWTPVEITQQKEGNGYRYHVKIGTLELMSLLNTKARVFTNVKLFVSNNFHPAAPGSIRNMVIDPLMEERVITKNTLLTTIPHLSRAYSVRFEMKIDIDGNILVQSNSYDYNRKKRRCCW